MDIRFLLTSQVFTSQTIQSYLWRSSFSVRGSGVERPEVCVDVFWWSLSRAREEYVLRGNRGTW